MLLALLLGIPTLRLRADYLAIVTIAAAEIVRLVFRSVAFEDVFGGSDGQRGFSDAFYALNPFPAGEYGIGCVRLQRALLWVLHRRLGAGRPRPASSSTCSCSSPWGRVLKAIREDEDAVRSLGKNVFSYKMQSLVLGGVIGCARRASSSRLALRLGAARHLRHRADLLRVHDRSSSAAPPACSAPSSARSIFWVLLVLI